MFARNAESHRCCCGVHQMSVWSSGMIRASGARGLGFDSRNRPICRAVPVCTCWRERCCLVGPMDKATAYGAVDSGFESQAGLGPPFGGAPIKIGTIQRRLAWPLRKDDTHKSRWYRYFFTDTVAERLRRWTRNPLGFSRMSSNLIGVDVCP